MRKYYFLIIASIFFFFVGCGEVSPVSNEAISGEIQKQKDIYSLLEEGAEDSLEDAGKELYFLDTKGKIFYNGVSWEEDDFSFKTQQLLNALFFNAKGKLPRKSRRTKLYISVVVGKHSYKKQTLLEAAQKFILSHRRYALANTDKESLRVLQEVLRNEKDGIYEQSRNINLRKSSDIVLYLSSQKKGKTIQLKAKIIAKNAQILAQESTLFNNVNIRNNAKWVSVKVPVNEGADFRVFEVMVEPVSEYEFFHKGGDFPVTNISFGSANNYCAKVLDAQLIEPYVFEYARRMLAMKRPKGVVRSEIIAPFDEEDQDIFYQEGDELEGDDSSIILFDWDSEKYYSISNLYRSRETTFRCMRSK